MSILGSFPLTYQPSRTGVGRADYLPNYPWGNSFFEFNNQTIYYDLKREEDFRVAYLLCAPLKAAINRRAQMFVNGKITAINSNNDKPLRGEYQREINKLFTRPNIIQTGVQFFAQHNIYIDLFGYCPVLKVTPIGMPASVKALWNLPPWLFDLEFQKNNFWNQKDLKSIYKSFSLKWNGATTDLDMDSVFISIDNSIGTDDDGNLLLPDSRCRSLELAISNDIAAKKAANTLVTKKGAIGILSKDAGSNNQYAPLKLGDEKKVIQDDFKRYGMTGQEWQVIVTDAALKWQSMSFPVKDLMLFELMTASLSEICDGVGIYSYLMNSRNSEGTTFNNLNEAKKSQYQDFIIPDANARIQQLSENIIPEENNAKLQIDYSHVEVLQATEQAKAVTRAASADAFQAEFDLGIKTRNQILTEMGLPTVNDPAFDLYSFQFPTPQTIPPARFPTQASNE